MKNKVCCFGELLMRLSPNTGEDWINNTMPFHIGGAELNVATALAKWDIPVTYVTSLPKNYLSGQLIKYIVQKNIAANDIVFSGTRIGIYYLPIGYDIKNVVAFYDRDNTSFSGLKPGVIDWDKIFSDCSWFHFSAISPGLNENVAAVCKEAVEAASAKGITISVDLNYRSKLWQYGKQPVDVIPDLVKHCNVIMGNMWAVESLLGILSPIESSDGKTQQQLIDAAGQSMLQLHRQYPQATTFAYTFRLENTYWAVLQHGNERAVSNEYIVNNTVDKVGSGDCFMAGLIYGLIEKNNTQNIVEYAAAAAVGKLYEAGDATKQKQTDILERVKSVTI
jgi:2-dehydro-3-deoxygluconokinase